MPLMTLRSAAPHPARPAHAPPAITGQRVGEIERWRPDFLSGNLLTIPGTITKNKLEQLLPLDPGPTISLNIPRPATRAEASTRPTWTSAPASANRGCFAICGAPSAL